MKQLKSLGHIVRNNLYILRIAMKHAPELVIYRIMEAVFLPISDFFAGVWSVQYMINGFQSGKGFSEMAIGILAAHGAYLLFYLLFRLYDAFRLPIVSLRMEEALNAELFRIASAVELACFEDKQFYDDYVKASGNFVPRVHQVLDSVKMLIWYAVSLFTYSFFVLTIDPILLVFVIFPVVISFLLSGRRNRMQHEYDMNRQEEERQREYTRRTFYLADYAKEMRLTNIHRVMLDRFDRSVKNIVACIKRYGFRLSVLDYVMNESKEVIASMGAMLYAGYATLIRGSMQYGDCLVLLNAIQLLVAVLTNSVGVLMRFQSNSLYVDTIRTFLEYEPKIRDGEWAAPEYGDLSMSHVSFAYPGQENDVLHDISLTVHAGEKIALVGHNGAGKSTLIKLLMRLYDPREGEVRYAGRNVKDYRLGGGEGYRDRFGVAFQDFQLFAMSVRDNLLLRHGRASDDALIDESLRNSGASEKIASFEEGAEAILTREFDEGGKVLSGGEAQKLSIARAFAKNGSILILDEPSSALDPLAEAQMYENMMRIGQNRSVIFISHRMASATLADRIIYLENGRIEETGTHKELMALNGKYAELFRIQAQNYVREEQEVQHG